MLRPSFIKVEDRKLQELATNLVGVLQDGVGQTRGHIEESLEATSRGFRRPKVAKGLAKLLLDRASFLEDDQNKDQARRDIFQQAAAILRKLPGDAPLKSYEDALQDALGTPLEGVRNDLYADLKDRQPLLAWKKETPGALLERYNMALAQGPLLYAKSLIVRTKKPEVLRVRKLLRWLRFTRLVAELKQNQDRWCLEVEGPGNIVCMHRKYGLQLAQFLLAVPLLTEFQVLAQVELPRKGPCRMALTEQDPLVSPLKSGLGHVPKEVAAILDETALGLWTPHLSPEPRHVGASEMCVPDLVFVHAKTSLRVAVELFHPWHKNALEKRLKQLSVRKDPHLLLGVDRSVLRGAAPSVAEHPQIFAFNKFPSRRAIQKMLDRVEV